MRNSLNLFGRLGVYTFRDLLVVSFKLTVAVAISLLVVASCSRTGSPATQAASAPPAAVAPSVKRQIRSSCVVQAVQAVKIMVPHIKDQDRYLTLTQLIPGGSRVKEGDLIATFDAAAQLDSARDAQAKFEDLGYQVEQRTAEIRASRERRTSDLRQAEANLAKAELELSKGQVLSDIDRQKNEARAAGARTNLASLKKSTAYREKSEAASLQSLELQRDRQKIAMQRAQDNIRALEVRAPLAGMVVHELTYRSGSYGRAQIGDQVVRDYPLVSIFEPAEMLVRCSVNEPDILALQSADTASVFLDAYPNLLFPAHFAFASPVASAPLRTPIKSFMAVFKIDTPDPHLLPDLTAGIILAVPAGQEPSGAAGGVR
jgi:multidrug efflux pump subunit AcrA (membrane-fusion protein)